MPEGIITVELPPSGLSAWPSDALTDDSRELLYQAVLARQASAQMDAAKVRRMGVIVGTLGAGCAAVMAVGCLIVYEKTPVPPPPGYILVDKSDGTITQPIGATQIPKSFPEITRAKAMRDFITSCETYVPETFRKVEWHNCMLMATIAEQKLIAAEIGPKGPRDPTLLFVGPGTPQAVVSKFTEIRSQGEAGVDPNQTYHYQVRYERTEFTNGHETRPHYTAQVTFQFHPELKASMNDRLINPYGLQVISFSTTLD